MIEVEVLAALSASAAAGIRIALPLLVIGLLRGEKLWSGIPILSYIHPSLILVVLISWSLIEVVAAKKLLVQRLLQVFQLIFSPVVGAIMAIAVTESTSVQTWLIGLIGGLFAFVLQLVQTGWFYRWRSLPLWMVFVQDILCVSLVFFAVKAPLIGGLIALILLLLTVTSSNKLRRWYVQQQQHR